MKLLPSMITAASRSELAASTATSSTVVCAWTPSEFVNPPRDRARPAHVHGLASTATLCGGIGTVGALWIVLALLGFLPTVGGTNPVRFESDSILGMRIQSHWLPTTGQYLAYQRDTYTNVTGRDLQLEAGRTTSLFKTMTETLDLARTNIASGVKEDDLKPIKDLLKMADRSPTDVAQTYMHDPAMRNTTALTNGTSYLRKYVLKATRTLRPLRSQRQRSHKAVLMAEVR